MSKNKIIEETVETIIDNIEEKLVDYMFEYGEYSETNNKLIVHLETQYNTYKLILSNKQY